MTARLASWFERARFGMFVHWDHASQQGLEVSWPLVGGVFSLPKCQAVPVEQYHSSAATFDPGAWDPRALARSAREAGMEYVVLTAKHHNGWALWPTALSPFSVASSPYGRDIVAEFVEAVRDEGLRVGLYLSLSDWHHPDYPAFTDEMKPYAFGASPPFPGQDRWERYLDHLSGQLRELLTGYGTIDLLWFDGGWERPADAWRPHELVAMIRSLQPEIVLNDRLHGVGDYATPEQFVPPSPPPGPWETCMTMNDSWGFVPADTDYKSSRRLVHTLCEIAGRGGRLLLNVSPTGDGSLPPEQVERLQEVASWMSRNGGSIIGTEAGLEPWQHYGPSTRRGSTVYLHLLARPYGEVTVRGIPVRRVASVRDVASGVHLPFAARTGILESLGPDPEGELTIQVTDSLLDPLATVLALELTTSP